MWVIDYMCFVHLGPSDHADLRTFRPTKKEPRNSLPTDTSSHRIVRIRYTLPTAKEKHDPWKGKRRSSLQLQI